MEILQEYKCPCCGGAIEFSSKLQKMKCPYCDTEFDVDAFKEYDQALHDEADSDMTWECTAGSEWEEGETDSVAEYVCNSCGGVVVADVNTAAASCPYCDNPIVMMGKVSGTLKPDYIIPFKLDKEAAKRGYLSHIKGKKLLPDAFKYENHIDEIKGIYVPFWLFDADTDARIRYKCTRVRSWSDSRYRYTETSYYAATRSGQMCFERVPVDGSSKIPNDLMESIEPFDFSEVQDFKTAYFAGYLADKYDVSSEESVSRANDRIKNSTEAAFAKTVTGYTTVRAESSNVRLSNGTAKYAMYPVWLLNTTWKGTKYTFAMNGQTGKFTGDLPMDKKKYWRRFFIYTGIFAAISFFIAYLAVFM